MRRFNTWIKEVKEDLDTPDLWAELQRDAQLLGGVSAKASENTAFTSEERREIEERLRKVEEHARTTYSLTEPELEVLHAKIDYLIGAAGRLGRIDWRNIVVGTIVFLNREKFQQQLFLWTLRYPSIPLLRKRSTNPIWRFGPFFGQVSR